jgi:uncharacterized protein (TIGR02147 family)
MRDYRDILKEELDRRCALNPRYSLRAFARDLGIAPSRISEVLNGRRGISETAGARLARRLGLEGLVRDGFVASIAAQHGRGAARKAAAATRLERLDAKVREAADAAKPSYYRLAWYNGAVLQLAKLKRVKLTVATIVERLGIRDYQAEMALRYLQRTGYLRQGEGRLVLGAAGRAEDAGRPTQHLRLQLSQMLDKAREASEALPEDHPDFPTTTLALDAQRVDELRALIGAFQHQVRLLAAQSRGRDRVYGLNLQLFRLDKETTR